MQKPTVVVLNAALVCCILVLVALLLLSIQGAPYLVIHVCFLLAIAVGLLILINWSALKFPFNFLLYEL